MFAVLFEVRPRADRWDGYLDLARMLRPELETIDGFLENTRYRSRTRDGVILSLSLWRDEKSVIRWRTHGKHHAGQALGRSSILADYRLRVGEVSALSVDGAPVALPAHRFDETEVGPAKAMLLRLSQAGPDTTFPGRPLEADGFDGVVDPSARAELAGYGTQAEAREAFDGARGHSDRLLSIRVIRDYGQFRREEAPQFHPPVATGEPAA